MLPDKFSSLKIMVFLAKSTSKILRKVRLIFCRVTECCLTLRLVELVERELGKSIRVLVLFLAINKEYSSLRF